MAKCFYCNKTKNLHKEIIKYKSWYENNKIPNDTIYVCKECRDLIEKYKNKY